MGAVVKGLIIDEPWIGYILAGLKTWEMRKTGCKVRGPVALIRKGSGYVVGVAEAIDAPPAIANREAYAATEMFHRVPPERQERAFADGWRTPWVLANARKLQRTVPYRHPSGAVIWVNLQPETTTDIEAQIN
jgi:hypothetical protein